MSSFRALFRPRLSPLSAGALSIPAAALSLSAGALSLSAALAFSLGAAPAAQAYNVDPAYNRERTALAVVHPDGRVSMSPAAEEPRAALSLAKLFLAYYVLYNGTPEEKAQIKDMIAKSDDGIASRLDAKYPEGINQIAEDFDLKQTFRNGYWGQTQTSARDVATFIASIVWDPAAKPLFEGMEQQQPVAADGFYQGFGTARLKDVKGSKMGWSDDRVGDTGSVSWGKIGDETFAVAALTYGTAYQNTLDTRVGINEVEDTPDDTGAPRRRSAGSSAGSGSATSTSTATSSTATSTASATTTAGSSTTTTASTTATSYTKPTTSATSSATKASSTSSSATSVTTATTKTTAAKTSSSTTRTTTKASPTTKTATVTTTSAKGS